MCAYVSSSNSLRSEMNNFSQQHLLQGPLKTKIHWYMSASQWLLLEDLLKQDFFFSFNILPNTRDTATCDKCDNVEQLRMLRSAVSSSQILCRFSKVMSKLPNVDRGNRSVVMDKKLLMMRHVGDSVSMATHPSLPMQRADMKRLKKLGHFLLFVHMNRDVTHTVCLQRHHYYSLLYWGHVNWLIFNRLSWY